MGEGDDLSVSRAQLAPMLGLWLCPVCRGSGYKLIYQRRCTLPIAGLLAWSVGLELKWPLSSISLDVEGLQINLSYLRCVAQVPGFPGRVRVLITGSSVQAGATRAQNRHDE